MRNRKIAIYAALLLTVVCAWCAGYLRGVRCTAAEQNIQPDPIMEIEPEPPKAEVIVTTTDTDKKVPKLFKSFTVRVLVNTKQAQDSAWVKKKLKSMSASIASLDSDVDSTSLLRIKGVYKDSSGTTQVTELWSASNGSE